MTKRVNANVSTQVNADKIGVLIAGGTVTKVTGIIVDFSMNVITVSDRISGIDATVICDSNGDVYYTIQGETTGDLRYIYHQYGSESTLFNEFSTPEVGQTLYNSENEAVSTISVVFSTTGVFFNSDGTHFVNYDYKGSWIKQGDFLVDESTGDKVGYITVDTTYSDDDCVFTFGGTSGGSQTSWNHTFDVINADIQLLTEGNYYEDVYPTVGQDALFSPDNPTYNVQTVKGLVEEEEEIIVTPNCTVSYSVNGETWTDHSTVLTDFNNVINNIPRYMYLKFSQNVIITEE